MSWLVYGGGGWIGRQFVDLLRRQGRVVQLGCARIEDREHVAREIDACHADRIINLAGKTGVPNVDWCEDHKEETLRSNVLGIMTLVDVAFLKGIHVTHFGTGCIYEYDSSHPIGSGIGFTEEDPPNFDKSFYSKTKALGEKLLVHYPNLLILRLRMPISEDLHPRSFLTKIASYRYVVNVPNSISLLPDLLPVATDMSEKKITGILDLYREYLDPDYVYENFSLEEQAKILKAGRSNNELDCTKLLSLYPGIPPARKSIVDLFLRMKLARIPPLPRRVLSTPSSS